MYVLLFSIARNIVFMVIVISHDYSLPLSKLFSLKGSLNLKERRGNFLKVLVKVVRSKWFRCVHKVSSSHGRNTLVKMLNMGEIVNMNIPFLVSPAAFGV